MSGDASGFKQLTIDADSLRKAMGAVVKESEKLRAKVLNFAVIATSIDSVNTSFNNLLGLTRQYTQATAAQTVVETQLATNMRNSMNARDQDIQSIKELCSAQQELGVIGDEVQLAGAQELTTYLEQKTSLEKLIPVMNDMLAQQYGLNATQENAAQIATMLGKVMNGQTGALSRYGYSFDAAQEQILKFGTESQRAAVLADVVSASVGGMNAELAKTDIGKQKQLENTIGDIKEKIGDLLKSFEPFLSTGAEIAKGASEFIKLSMAIKTAVSAISSMQILQKGMHMMMIMGTGSIKKATRALRIFSTAAKDSAARAVALKIAMRGLMVTTGVGLAIAGLIWAIGKLIDAYEEGKAKTDRFREAQERVKRNEEEMQRMREEEESQRKTLNSQLEIDIATLKNFNGTKAEEKKIVKQMNDTYGETMGYFASVESWYKALTSNSEAYCRQMIIEARTRILANQIAEKQQENYNLTRNADGSTRMYSSNRGRPALTNANMLSEDARNKYLSTGKFVYTTDEKGIGTLWHKSDKDYAQDEYDSNTKIIDAAQKELDKTIKEGQNIKFNVTGSNTRPEDAPKTAKNTAKNETKLNELEKIEAQIKVNQEAILTADETEAKSLREETLALVEKRDELRKLQEDLVKKPEVKYEPPQLEEIKTYKQLDEALKYYQDRLQEATIEERADINEIIKKIKELRDEWDDALNPPIPEKSALDTYVESLIDAAHADFGTQVSPLEGLSVDQLLAGYREIQRVLQEMDGDLTENQRKSLQAAADEYLSYAKKASTGLGTISAGWNNIKGFQSGVEGITEALTGNGNAWERISGIIDGFISIFENVKAVVGIINTITAATRAATAATQAHTIETVADTGATIAHTAAEEGDAVASATASGAALPFPANIAAIAAAVAAVMGALAIVGSFATGGVVGGNSHSGDRLLARVNSGEMILNAQQQGRLFNLLDGGRLDTIRGNLISPQPVIVGGTFRVSGRDLVAALANETRITGVSGRKTNIRL